MNGPAAVGHKPPNREQDATTTHGHDSADTVRRDLILLTALALLYRLAFLWATPRVLDSADALRYLDVARLIREGSFSAADTYIPPLYPALTAFLSAMGIEYETAARAVSIVCSVAVVLPVYGLARRMHGIQAARVCAVIVAIWPWLADWGCSIAPESLAVLLWFTGVWCLARAVEGRSLWAIGAALVYFALNLTRPEGLILLAAAPLVLLMLSWNESRRWRNTAAFIASAALLLAVQSIVSLSVRGSAAVSPRVNVRGTWEYVIVQRGEALLETFSTVISHNLPVMLGPILLAFAGIGLLGSGTRRWPRLEIAVLGFAGLQTALAILSTWPEPRYIMTVVIALSMWSASGVVIVSRRIAVAGQDSSAIARFRGTLAALPFTVVLLTMAMGAAFTVLPEHAGRTPRAPLEYRIAGEWMRSTLEPGLIICRKPQVGYYAHMPSTGPVDYPTLERFLVWMRAIDAKYLVVDERYTAQMTNVVRTLLDPANAPDDLILLRDDLSPYPDARLVIYAIADEGAEP